MESDIDLVCGMAVDPDSSRFFSEYDQKSYVFCSAECKRKFDDHPDYFIHLAAKEKLDL